MTDNEIKSLRGLMRAATPGPLTVMARHAGEQCVAVVNQLELVPPNGVELAHEKADADFLAAAVNALPGLLDEVERLRAALEVTPAPVTLEAAEWAIDVFKAEEEQMRADAARLDYIEKHARYDPKMDGQHAWWPTTFEHVLRGPTLRAAIDAAMGGEKRE